MDNKEDFKNELNALALKGLREKKIISQNNEYSDYEFTTMYTLDELLYKAGVETKEALKLILTLLKNNAYDWVIKENITITLNIKEYKLYTDNKIIKDLTKGVKEITIPSTSPSKQTKKKAIYVDELMSLLSEFSITTSLNNNDKLLCEIEINSPIKDLSIENHLQSSGIEENIENELQYYDVMLAKPFIKNKSIDKLVDQVHRKIK